MRFYLVKTVNGAEFVPMAKVGTYPDVSCVGADLPMLAPAAFHEHLTTPLAWYITLIDTRTTEIAYRKVGGHWIAYAGRQAIWEDVSLKSLKAKLTLLIPDKL